MVALSLSLCGSLAAPVPHSLETNSYAIHRGNEHRAPRGSLHFPFDRYLPTGNWKAHLPQFCCVFDASTLQLPLSVFLVNHRSYSASVCPSVQILSGGGGGFVIGGWVHLRDVCGTAFSGELGWVWSGVPFEGAAIFLFFLATSAAKQRKGASRYEVLKSFAFYDPLPPCPHLDLIYTMKFIQPPSLRLLFHEPPPMWTSYLDAPQCCSRHGGAGINMDGQTERSLAALFQIQRKWPMLDHLSAPPFVSLRVLEADLGTVMSANTLAWESYLTRT